jgi:hypothetical protein
MNLHKPHDKTFHQEKKCILDIESMIYRHCRSRGRAKGSDLSELSII